MRKPCPAAFAVRVGRQSRHTAWKLKAQHNRDGVGGENIIIAVVARSLFRQWRAFIGGDILSCGAFQQDLPGVQRGAERMVIRLARRALFI